MSSEFYPGCESVDEQMTILRTQRDYEKARADRLEQELSALRSIYLNVDLLAAALADFVPRFRKNFGQLPNMPGYSDSPEPDVVTLIEDWESRIRERLMPCLDSVFVTTADLAAIVEDIVGSPVKSAVYIPLMERLGFVRTTRRVDGGKPTGVWCRGNSKTAVRVTFSMPGAAP